MPRDVNHICCPRQHKPKRGYHCRHTVNTALDPDIPMLVPRSTIACIEHGCGSRGIACGLPRWCARRRAKGSQELPRHYCLAVPTPENLSKSIILNGKAHVRPRGSIENRRFNTEERHSSRPRLSLDSPRERRNHNRPSLRLPESIILLIPHLGINRLPNAAQHAQTAQIVLLDMVRAEAVQEAD
jgi:hypothetical protein